MMSDLPFGAVRVEMNGALASFIGAHGEVLGSREIGPARSRDAESAVQAEFTDNDGNTIGLVFRKHPFRYLCTACGCRCEASTYSTRSPECFKHDVRADWKIVTEEEWQQAVRLAPQIRQRTAPQLRENEEEIHGSR